MWRTAADRLTDAQSMASAELVRWLAAEYGIPAANVVGHKFAPGNEGTTDCPNHLFGEETAEAVAGWVTANVGDAAGSKSRERGEGLRLRMFGRRALQTTEMGHARQRGLPGCEAICAASIRMSERLPQTHAAALTALELMTIALEDRRFFHHPGVDARSVLRETLRVLTGRKHGGASTIDMQFVRTVTGFRAPTVKRKVYEAFLALVIQFRHKKLEILRSYLACAYFGSGLIGANAAAQKIFNKNADRLGIEEASLISAMLAYPRPLHGLPRWEQRARRRAAYAVTVFARRKRRLAGPYEMAAMDAGREKQKTARCCRAKSGTAKASIVACASAPA